jgi:pimeloyl-ACP methyl ester carboxylesterase
MPIKPVRDENIIAGDLTFHYVQWGTQGSPIIAYDLRGRGDSDKPESGYSIPLHAADLAALIDQLELDRPIDAGAPFEWKTPEEQPAWLTTAINRLGTPTPSFEEYKQRLKATPFLGPYWNSYIDLYFEHDVYQQSDGSVIAKAYREGILEDNTYNCYEYKPQELWKHVTVPTLLLRAGQGLFTDNDQLLSEKAAEAIHHGIQNCRYVNFPKLNHYTIAFGIDSDPATEIRNFIEKE